MGLAGLEFAPLHVPFSAGLNTKGDPRTQQPPYLDIARDVQFDNVGGLTARYPYAAVGPNILGGGTLANVRRVFANGPELCCLTDTTLYSWDARDSAWVARGTHLAVATTETDVFDDPLDQYDADRAELGNAIVYAWTEGTNVYAAAKDKTTGAVILPPTAVSVSAGAPVRPRLVALSTKILLLWAVPSAAQLLGISLDPAAITVAAVAGTPTVILSAVGGINFTAKYDVCRVIGADTAVIVAIGNPVTFYIVASVTASLTVAAAAKARRCDSAIAVASHTDGLHVEVVYANENGPTLKGDFITIAGLVDVFVGSVLDGALAGSATTRLAAAWTSVKISGSYRCRVFYNRGDTAPNIRTSWVDDSNAVAVASTYLFGASGSYLTIASRAFDYNGGTYFWALFKEGSAFAGANYASFRAQLQNTYFLYRDDGFLCAQAAVDVAGDVATDGFLPNVVLTAGTTTFSWAGLRKRKVILSPNQSGLSTARVPRDLTFTFDSNDARRTARIGGTLYLACGEGVLCYDGTRIVECGFHVYPWSFAVTDFAAGNMAAGDYAYKMTHKWVNAIGEVDRSTTATVAKITMGANREAQLTPSTYLGMTHKTASVPAAEVWRTAVSPTKDVPFYLATSDDPANSTNPNRYLASNSASVLNDNLADASLTVLQSNPQNGAVLENLGPPPATIIIANDTRIFLAGIAGDPHRVWYSKQRQAGDIASFHDALVIPVPLSGGNITALAFLTDSLIVARQRAIFELPGDGLDNFGLGNNYGPARLLSSDVGVVNADAIALSPMGLFFKSSKGWYLLGNGRQLKYVGAPVNQYDAETVLSVHVVESTHQIRCLTASRMLVYDYYVDQWAEWTIADGLHAALWNGAYVYAATGGPKQEQTTYTSLTYGIDVETAWIKVNDLQGRGVVRMMQLLGEWRSDHNVRLRAAVNYASDGAGGWTYVDDVKPPAPAPTLTAGSPLQVRHGPSVKRVQAIKLRITAVANDGTNNPPTGEALRLTGLVLDVGVEPGIYKGLSAAQKA